MLLGSCRQFIKFRVAICHHRSLQSEASNNEIPNQEPSTDLPPVKKTRKPKEVKTQVKVTKEMKKYFEDQNQQAILDRFPNELFKIKKELKTGIAYIANENTARTIADHVAKNIRRDQTLMEANPGPGLLTEHLLKLTKHNRYLLYEPTPSFHSNLKDALARFPNRETSLRKADINMIWQMDYLDKADNGCRVDTTLAGLSRKDFDGVPNARLFATTSSMSFLHHLINSILFQKSIMTYGRCELYLCVNPKILKTLTCSKESGYLFYRSASVLFQLLFEYEYICEFNRKDFLPWLGEKVGQSASKRLPSEHETVYFLRAVPRKDFHRYCLPENMQKLWFFMKQHFRSRVNRVIPSLERWIPGCGPRLLLNLQKTKTPDLLDPQIDMSSLPDGFEPCRKLSIQDFKNDIDIMTEYGDLTPTQLLTIFDQFISWPEYNDCSFNASLDSMLLRMQSSSESVDDLDAPVENESQTNKTPKA